jgi:hypothetical protein
MTTFASAFDRFFAFVKSHPHEILRSEMELYYELDMQLYVQAFSRNLDRALPKQHEVERPLYHPSLPQLPPVIFEGKTNLPGDWINNSFIHCAFPRWERDMIALRALAETQQPVERNENENRKKKGKRIDERMLAVIREDPTAEYWSLNQWKEKLECAKSTVHGTRTWQHTCKPMREAERLTRGHRLRKAKKRIAPREAQMGQAYPDRS